ELKRPQGGPAMRTRLICLLALCLILTFCQSTNSQSPPSGDTRPRTDLYGDPLPEGAIARFGTVRLRHGSYAIQSVAFSPDGKVLVSVGYDSVIRIWDTATGRPVRQFPGHWNVTVSFTPNGKMLVIGANQEVLLLDVVTGKE